MSSPPSSPKVRWSNISLDQSFISPNMLWLLNSVHETEYKPTFVFCFFNRSNECISIPGLDIICVLYWSPGFRLLSYPYFLPSVLSRTLHNLLQMCITNHRSLTHTDYRHWTLEPMILRTNVPSDCTIPVLWTNGLRLWNCNTSTDRIYLKPRFWINPYEASSVYIKYIWVKYGKLLNWHKSEVYCTNCTATSQC